MFRSIAILSLMLSSFLFRADDAFAQLSPPICPEGSWPIRSSSGWTCTKKLPSDLPPTPAANTNNSNSNMRGGHGRGGGMPQ